MLGLVLLVKVKVGFRATSHITLSHLVCFFSNGMRKGFKELQELNQDLLGGYQVRSTNHEELVKSLKLVNQLIQKASHLRGNNYQIAFVVANLVFKIKSIYSSISESGVNLLENCLFPPLSF